MKIEIDLNKIVEKIDISQLVKEELIQNIIDSTSLDDKVEELLSENEEIGKKILGIIDEYLSSEDGKNYIIDQFEEKFVNSDILSDDRIQDLTYEFLKKKLKAVD